MQSVLKKLPAVPFLLGEGQADRSASYRKASFCIFTEVDGQKVAYNTLTKELVELSETEAASLERDSATANEVTEPLIRSRFLMRDGEDEKALCDGLYAFARASQKRGGYRNFTVFTTTECNARCFYCYENDCNKSSMSDETALAAASFIADASLGEAVNITWYGGEPLMNTQAIDIISEELSSRGIKFSSKLATNASLLDDTLADRAKNVWHVTKAQVTLDGTPAVYDRIKAYTDRKNAFFGVLENIECLLDKNIQVNIRLNVDVHNIDDMEELCDLLAERFALREGVNIYFALLFDCDGAKRPLSECDREALARRVIALEDFLSERGVLKPRKLKNFVSTCFCKADSPDSLVISPAGKLLKCDFYTDEHIVGDVQSGVCKESEAKELSEFSRRLDCGGCTAYPICLRSSACPTGGCDGARRYITEERLVRSVRYAYLIAKKEQK